MRGYLLGLSMLILLFGVNFARVKVANLNHHRYVLESFRIVGCYCLSSSNYGKRLTTWEIEVRKNLGRKERHWWERELNYNRKHSRSIDRVKMPILNL